VWRRRCTSPDDVRIEPFVWFEQVRTFQEKALTLLRQSLSIASLSRGDVEPAVNVLDQQRERRQLIDCLTGHRFSLKSRGNEAADAIVGRR
jgi:hypothetical protein